MLSEAKHLAPREDDQVARFDRQRQPLLGSVRETLLYLLSQLRRLRGLWKPVLPPHLEAYQDRLPNFGERLVKSVALTYAARQRRTDDRVVTVRPLASRRL